jgi:DNA-binding response OmpR family regulator
MRSRKMPVVMVIEPEVLVRMTIAEYLRACGYHVIEGIVAADVWTVLESGTHLDVVFSEVHLAGDRDGFALAKRLRQTNPGIDVILTSGVTSAAEKSEELCEDGPIKKPYRAEDVVARIKLLLERRRSSGRRRSARE